MNAQSVWGGHEYAYVHYVRKKHFPMDAIKCKVVSTRKVVSGYKSRADAYATVEFEHGGTREVNVRNLYDFWDSYTDERNGRIQEKQRREEEARREALERAAARQREQERANAIGERLAWKLGIDPSRVTVNHYAESVTIPLQDLAFLMED
jgi:hypothetical protein